jgi:predicted MPP superfamily phosphohydrolase
MPWAVRMFLIVSAVALPLYLYVGFRTATAIAALSGSPPRRARFWALGAIGWLYLLPVLYVGFWLGGNRSAPLLGDTTLGLLDYLFNFPFWWGLIVLLETLPYFLLLEAIGLVSRMISAFSPFWRRWAPRLRVATLSFIALYAAVRIYLDTFTVNATSVSVQTGVPAPELDSLTITLAADIQVDRYTNGEKIWQFETLFRAHRCDLLLFAGDLVTNGKGFIAQASAIMAHPDCRLGAFAVMGDHDYWSDPNGIPQILRSSGWTFLTDEHHVVEHRGRRILLSGVTYIYSQRISESELRAFLSAAPPADLKILLVHQPAEMLVRLAAEAGYHLVLAGHTHGGQIVLHPFGVPVAPSIFETPFYRGTQRVGNTTVIVTGGVGQSLAPVRYGAPAELTYITLRTAR